MSVSAFLLRLTALLLTSLWLAGGSASEPTLQLRSGPQWWKGNTHTHTLWSDGDAAPEWVAEWYKSRGYHFLVLSDHNIFLEGDRWFPIGDQPGDRLTRERVDELRSMFESEAWVEERAVDGQAADAPSAEMRLKTLGELRAHFEEPGRFLFIQGEEITDGYDGRPVHVNGLNLAEKIEPQGGASVQEVMQRNIDAVIEQGQRLQRPVLAHINHPNFGWGLTPEDVAAVRGERFFEVYNGHSGVRNYGDDTHPSTEELWDIALTLRLTSLDLDLLYGLATDDSHEYFEEGVGFTNPGRGWLMVRADTLTPDAIILALRSGDFYATSGVLLEKITPSADQYRLRIEAEEGLTYTTRFIGTRMVDGEPGPVGEVLHETTDNPAVYPFRGDELYVRARVSSSRLHPNPYAEGDFETAWAQPVRP